MPSYHSLAMFCCPVLYCAVVYHTILVFYNIMIIITVRGEVKMDKKYDYILLLLARVRVKNYFVWSQQFLVISLHLHSKLTTEAASESNSSKEEFVRMQ